jgi:F0F1-type ATP synthase epsilon subunit
MLLTITSPEEQHILKAAWFEIDTPVGNFVIHAGHTPTILTLLPKSTITIRLTSGKQKTIQASRGIVHITRKASTIILGD